VPSAKDVPKSWNNSPLVMYRTRYPAAQQRRPIAWIKWLLPQAALPHEYRVVASADEITGGQLFHLHPIEYLADPPIAMALLDRVVDGAIIHKFQGKSYRAHRAKRGPAGQQSGNTSTAKRRPT
jgi:hypothetical protein